MRFFNYFLLFFIFILILFSVNAQEDNSLDFDAIKAKYIDVDVNIAMPIIINSYTENDYLTFKTPVFIDSRSQTVDVEAYYYDSSGEKVYATFEEDDFGNSIAVFKVDKINKSKYVFHVNSNIVSENKIVLSPDEYDLNNPISEYQDYKETTRNIQSHASEIISLASTIKQSNYALKEIVNVTNWVHNNVEYDLAYSSENIDALRVLANRKGVCDEFANLTAALLRADGFPVRYVSGYANSSVDWQAHAWIEVYVPGQGWIPADSTYGEVAMVDASHLVISKSTDPTKIKDRIETTSNVSADFGEKQTSFRINEQKSFSEMGYSDVLEIEFLSEEEMKQGSVFNVRARLKNTNATPLITAVVLQTHKSFTQIYPKENEMVYYLGPFEEKEINFYYLLPQIDAPTSYSYVFATQIKNFTNYVNIYKDRGLYEEAFFVLDPVFYFKNEQLGLDLKIINYTDEEKSINIDFNFDGESIFDTQTIPARNSLDYKKMFDSVDQGKLEMVISGDYDYSKIVNIYPDEIKIEPVEEDTNTQQENDQNNLNDVGDDLNNDQNTISSDGNQDIWDEVDNINVNKQVKNNTFAIVVAALIVVFIILLIVFRKKR